MFTKKNQREPLLRYWTRRYFITLVIGMILIGILSTLLIRHNAIQKRILGMSFIAEEIAESSVDNIGRLDVDPFLPRELERRQRLFGLDSNFSLLVVDADGNIRYSTLVLPPTDILQEITIPENQERSVQEIDIRPGVKYLIVKEAIKYFD